MPWRAHHSAGGRPSGGAWGVRHLLWAGAGLLVILGLVAAVAIGRGRRPVGDERARALELLGVDAMPSGHALRHYAAWPLLGEAVALVWAEPLSIDDGLELRGTVADPERVVAFLSQLDLCG